MNKKRITKHVLIAIILLLISCVQKKDINIRTLNVGYGYMFNASIDHEDDSLAGPNNDAFLLQKIIETTAAKYPNINYKKGYITTTRKKSDNVHYINDIILPQNKYVTILKSKINEDNFEYLLKHNPKILDEELLELKNQFFYIVEELCKENAKDDILIITISGHGALIRQTNRPVFILGRYSYGLIEYIYLDELFKLLSENSKGNVFVILDTCLSGNSVGKESGMGTLDISEKLPSIKLYDKVWVLSASKPGNNTYDKPFITNLSNKPAYQGLLSYSIAKYFGFDYKNMEFSSDSKSIVTTGTLYRGVKEIMKNYNSKTSEPKISGDPLELVLFAH